MSTQDKLNLLRDRYASKVNTPKNIKSQGVCKKWLRQIRRMENAANFNLPPIHSFERIKISEYEPVQDRINILNPSGMRNRDTFVN